MSKLAPFLAVLISLIAAAAAGARVPLSMPRAEKAILRHVSVDHAASTQLSACRREAPNAITCTLTETFIPSAANQFTVELREWPTAVQYPKGIVVTGSMLE